MIIECEECRAKFRLDEGLLREEGSRVRCSRCNRVFLAYPPGMAPDEGEPELLLAEELEETAALDSPPTLSPAEVETAEEVMQADFDKAFEEAVDTRTMRVVPKGRKTGGRERAPARKSPPRADGEESKAETQPVGEGIGEVEEMVEVEAMGPPGRKKARRVRLFPIILGVVILLLAGAAAVFLYAPQYIPDSLSFMKPSRQEQIKDLGVRRLSFKAVSGSFVESPKAGQLFVVKGMVSNDYPKSRSYVLVKGSVLDDKGKVVKTKLAYAGNLLTEKQLKEMSSEEINEALKDRLGKGKINVNIQPQAAVPFMIVFEGLPDNLSEFTVEAVSSSPGA